MCTYLSKNREAVFSTRRVTCRKMSKRSAEDVPEHVAKVLRKYVDPTMADTVLDSVVAQICSLPGSF